MANGDSAIKALYLLPRRRAIRAFFNFLQLFESELRSTAAAAEKPFQKKLATFETLTTLVQGRSEFSILT